MDDFNSLDATFVDAVRDAGIYPQLSDDLIAEMGIELAEAVEFLWTDDAEPDAEDIEGLIVSFAEAVDGWDSRSDAPGILFGFAVTAYCPSRAEPLLAASGLIGEALEALGVPK